MEWDFKKETNKEAIAIMRVSSRKQEDNTSLESQEKEIRKYCIARRLDIVRTDRLAESAKDADYRKNYDAAIKFALKNKIKHVLFYMNDREARNMTDIENNNKLILSGKIVVHHVQEGKVYWEYSTPSDFLIRNITSAVNHDFSMRLAVKINTGTTAKAEMGWYPHCKPPLGYICQREIGKDGRESRDGIAKIVPDPNEDNIKLVKREFELRSQGLSAEEIRKKILSEGFVPPSQHKSYSRNGIEKRLRNKFYYGRFDWKGKEYKGNHQLIIPADILRKVAASYDIDRGFSNKPTNQEALFGGWIKCGHPECARVIIFDPKRKVRKDTGEIKVHNYYHCANSRNVHASLKGLSITEEKIMDQLAHAVADIDISEEFAKDIADALNETERKAQEAIERQAAEFRKLLKELEVREDRAYEDFTGGILDSAGYKRQQAKVRADRDFYEKKLEAANKAINGAALKTARQILELCTNAKSVWKEAGKEKRVQYLKMLCSNPILDGGTIRYDLKKPFRVISGMRSKELWWRIGDSNS